MPIRRRLLSIARLLGPFVIPFLILLVISAPDGLDSIVTVFNIPITSRLGEAVTVFGGSDAGSLLSGALWWSEIHAISPGANWIYNLWPPGMVVVNVLVAAVETATGVPGVLVMVVLNCVVWAVFFGVCYRMIARLRGRTQAVVFVAVGLLFSGVTAWGTDAGLFYSDSFGAISLCFGLLLLVRAGLAPTTRRRIGLAALGGVFLGGAAYFRASYDLVALATVGVGAAILVASLAVTRIRRLDALRAGALRMAVPITVFGAAAQLFMLPWRIYAGLRIRPGDLRWSTVSDLTSGLRWIPNDTIAGFLGAGHANWSCLSDAQRCAAIARNEQGSAAPYTGNGYYTNEQFDQMSVQSFLEHPFEHIWERIRAVAMGFSSNDGFGIQVPAIAETLLIVALLVATIVVLVKRRRVFEPAAAWFIGLTLAQFATLAAFHQEARYYLGLELTVLVMAALVLGPLTYGGRRSEVVGLVPGAEAPDEATPARLADEQHGSQDLPPETLEESHRPTREARADTP